MKKLFLSLFFVSIGAFYSCSNESETENSQPTFENQTKSSSVSFGYIDGFSKRVECAANRGDCAIAIVQEGGMFSMKLERLGAYNKLMMSFTSENTGDDDRSSISFNNDVTIPEAMAHELGFSSITIKSGDYIVSYEDNSFGNVILDIKTSDFAAKSSGRCPEGTTEQWEYGFNSFNFHRPVKNCDSGFWFCFSGGSWEFVGCVDSTGRLWEHASDQLVIARMSVEEEDVLDFYFPYHAFTGVASFPDEFQVFSVDDALVFGDHKLIKGEYPVEFEADYVKISVPTINEVD